MSIQQKFKQALKCGTGKAYFILQEHPNVDFSKIIKKSLLKRQCYDGQCEGNRGHYYYELINVSPQKATLVDFVLEELQKDQSDWYILTQFYEIAALLGAKEDNETAKRGVRKRFKKELEETDDWDGGHALLRIDGVKALLGLAQLRGNVLKHNPDWTEYGRAIDQFDEIYPKANGSKIIRRASLQNTFIKRYWDYVQESKNARNKIKKGKKTKYNYKVITKGIKKDQFFWVSDRVKDFNKETIHTLALDLTKEMEPKRQERYLKIFAKCKFPLGTEILFDFIERKHKTPKSLVEPAVNALALFQSEEIRSYALEKLKKKKNILIYLPLLIRNYKVGDHILMDEILQKKWTTEEIHRLNYDYRAIYSANSVRESMLPLKRMYDQLNCGICRKHVLEIMSDNKVLTTGVLKEMKFDCDQYIRKLQKELKKVKKKAK
jgi:hypothetical protein